ncbi:cysteine peptidase family C39 domain-containing protein, partial [Porphyromonas levii]
MQEIEYIKQKDAMDCGPVCLAMVVKHYGCHPDL